MGVYNQDLTKNQNQPWQWPGPEQVGEHIHGTIPKRVHQPGSGPRGTPGRDNVTNADTEMV